MSSVQSITTDTTTASPAEALRVRIQELREEIEKKNKDLLAFRHELLRVELCRPEEGITCNRVTSENFEDEYMKQVSKIDGSDFEVVMMYDFTYRDPSNPNAEPVRLYASSRNSNFHCHYSDCYKGFCIVASRTAYNEHTHKGDLFAEAKSEDNAELLRVAELCVRGLPQW